MKQLLVLMHCLFFIATGFGQKKGQDYHLIETSILEEGKKLYQLETAQTLGVQTFKAQLSRLADSTEGYFSYKDGMWYKCVFYNRMFDAKIIATITFDSLFTTTRTAVNTISRPMNGRETDLYTLRRRAIEDIQRDTGLYTFYNETSLSLIPIAEGTNKKVYIITRSLDPDVIVFGNDYLLEYNTMNYVASKKALHKGLITVELPHGINNPENVAAAHKEVQEYMTATDVCNILLNRQKANWQSYVAKASNFVTVWYGDTNELQIVPRKKFDEYNKGVIQPDDDEEQIPAMTKQKKQ